MASSAVLRVLSSVGLKPSYYRHKSNEDDLQFVERMVKQLPKLLIKVESKIPVLAELYGVPDAFVLAVIQEYNLEEHRAKGTRVAVVKEADALAASELQREALESMGESVSDDKRLTRRNWPADADERASLMHEYLEVALVERAGNIVEVGDVLNIPVWTILHKIDESEDLQEALSAGERVQATIAASRIYDLTGSSPNTQAAKMVVQHHGGWTERQETTHKYPGFSAPKSNDKPQNILELYSSKKETG